MSIGQIFTVITEFKFDAAHFLANAAASSAAVEGITKAVNHAQETVQAFSLGFIGNMTGVSGGLLGILGNALSGYEDLTKAQLDLSVGLQATGLDFHNRMLLSSEVLKDLSKVSMQFGLPISDLINTTKMLAPMLLNEGLAGPGLSNVTDLSRQFLKASPTLGIDPFEAQGQLTRTLGGQASGGDTLFRRLTTETKSMREFVGQTKKFNQLAPAERLKKLTDGLGQFANQTKANEARVNSLSGQLRILKTQLMGPFSVFIPIAKALNAILLEALKALNNFIKDQVGPAIKMLSKSLGMLLPNIQSAAANFASLSSVQQRFKNSAKFFGITAMLIGLSEALLFLGMKVPIVSGLLAGFTATLAFLSKPLIGIASTGKISVITGMLRAAMSLLFLVTLIGEIAVRAAAIAKVNLIKKFSAMLVPFSAMVSKFLNVFAYFSEGMNVIAGSDAVQYLFQNILPWIAETLLWFADFVANSAVVLIAGFTAIVAGIMQFIQNIKNLASGGSWNLFKGVGDVSNAAADMTIEKLMPDLDKDGVSKPMIEINQHISMKNDFKEMLEPDRVAFTISEQLLKAARNATGSRGNGFAKADR